MFRFKMKDRRGISQSGKTPLHHPSFLLLLKSTAVERSGHFFGRVFGELTPGVYGNLSAVDVWNTKGRIQLGFQSVHEFVIQPKVTGGLLCVVY